MEGLEEAIRQVLARRGDPLAGGADGALDAIAQLIGERPSGHRIVIAHDLPMPVEVIAKHMQRIAENGDWYLVRDPAAQIYELLAEGDVSIFRDGDKYTAELHPRVEPTRASEPVREAASDSVEGALLALYRELRDGT